MSYLKSATVIVAFLGITAFVWASESDELRDKADAMQRQAAELAEQGHRQEAANLKRKAMTMLDEAEELERQRPKQREAEIMELKRLLEKLHQEEKHLREDDASDERLTDVRREAEHVEMELREFLHPSHHDRDLPRDEVAERLEHMHIAIEHLNQAGLHDMAEHVAQRAEATERELHEHRQHHDGDAMHEIMQQLEELRHEVGRLHDEVNELRERQ
ncbi:MAG: hypothetical protein GY903_33935 [Fuerstiella sp.]|nr:hypothetical protein [Fuerstiella sp.]MCP4859495.1 hypothetical protein [Fuerstiella sp.]